MYRLWNTYTWLYRADVRVDIYHHEYVLKFLSQNIWYTQYKMQNKTRQKRVSFLWIGGLQVHIGKSEETVIMWFDHRIGWKIFHILQEACVYNAKGFGFCPEEYRKLLESFEKKYNTVCKSPLASVWRIDYIRVKPLFAQTEKPPGDHCDK